MSEVVASPSSEPAIVQTDAGPVMLAPIDQLQLRIKLLTDWATNAAQTSSTWRAQASDHYAACGAILVPRAVEWLAPDGPKVSVERARTLVAQIGENDANAEQLKRAQSHGGVIHRIDTWRHRRTVTSERAAEAHELRELLIQIAKAAPSKTVAEAEAETRSASELETKAIQLDQQIDGVKRSLAVLTDEIGRRAEAARQMGFDALYEAAYLQSFGPQSVESPLLLKSGEEAYLSVPATLSRMVTRTRFVGGSSGFSFPIGHTGIRYRVGSFSGHPVQQQTLNRLDVGTLVLTNQRLAFIGRTKSTSIPLSKIVHVEVYTDAVAVFQESRENPDFYMTAQPKRVIFYLNWSLGHPSQPKR